MNKRLQEVLLIGVGDYIKTLLPITSGGIAEQIKKSSATIRNDLKTLEEMGYIRQLHKSGGRIPTVNGYREFIESKTKYEINSLSQVIIDLSNKVWELKIANLESVEILNVAILPLINNNTLFLTKTNIGSISSNLSAETPLTNEQADIVSNAITGMLRGMTLNEIVCLGQVYINTGPPAQYAIPLLKGGG
jgi:transcriptional regulator of heat shock response